MKLCIIALTSNRKFPQVIHNKSMCGIIGYLDKKNGPGNPLGSTLLAMLQALSCRGPDSVGVAWFGTPSPFWIIQIKLPEDHEP